MIFMSINNFMDPKAKKQVIAFCFLLLMVIVVYILNKHLIREEALIPFLSNLVITKYIC
jgi:hypothetical protein